MADAKKDMEGTMKETVCAKKGMEDTMKETVGAKKEDGGHYEEGDSVR